jgi:hypothetical protein
MRSRIPILLCALVLPVVEAMAQAEKVEVNFDYVTGIAAQRAKEPFHSPRADMPDGLVAPRILVAKRERECARMILKTCRQMRREELL